MPRFIINDMNCKHCVSTVTAAVKGRDPGATVDIDLAQKTVAIDSGVGDDALREAIQTAGYEPRPAV